MSYKKERKKEQTIKVGQSVHENHRYIISKPALHNSTHNAVIDIAKERQL